jgi:hypothetical protein
LTPVFSRHLQAFSPDAGKTIIRKPDANISFQANALKSFDFIHKPVVNISIYNAILFLDR